MAPRTALVTGVTGQVGYYVADYLRRRGDKVYGLVRQTTLARQATLAADDMPYEPVLGDLLDEYSLMSLIERLQPDAIFNFAAQSFIPLSWMQPILTAQYTALGVVRLLESVRRVAPRARFLQAGSSEVFASCGTTPQNERTALSPRNPYGIAKAFALMTVRAYREQYGLAASNAIFYTNESPRRAPEFLFRKVTRGVAEIVAGRRQELTLGNLATVRDWGYSPDYAEAAVRIVEHDTPGDFVVATGEGHTVEALVAEAFGIVGRDWRAHVRHDSALERPSEIAPLIGDPRHVARTVGWQAGTRFAELVKLMVAADCHGLGVAPPWAAAAAASAL
ncbi:MAG TPA: GDP-mannose 4,6-dehydratase [Polyangia bacterium]|jgi:GDPmannose 4,6-dehydratase